MGKHLNPNSTADQSRYASPVPFIGLYIAGASLLCFLLILADLINGLRGRKPWLPCRFFSLNSITLTLLAIASKLPVDLTTPMPSVLDQLSKITGTSFICFSMSFMLPSLGSNRASESATNMAALSILVITVIVNICIQMATGVISSFIVEHVLIMYCMLIMLFILWGSTWEINMHKEIQINRKKELLSKGSESMLPRLELCYLHGYDSNPQFVLCTSMYYFCGRLVFALCFIVVLEVAIRSLVGHEFGEFNGLSDYKWSMGFIVVTQILVILLASLATGIRWLAVVGLLKDMPFPSDIRIITIMINNFPILKADAADYLNCVTRILMILGTAIMALLLLLPGWAILLIEERYIAWFERKHTEIESIQEYRGLVRENGMVLEEWTLTKCVKDMKRWQSVSQKCNSPRHLRELLSKTPPSRLSLEQFNSQYNFQEGREVSCLYLVFLARVASSLPPSIPCGHLTQSLSEVFDIVHFVDTKMNSLTLDNKKRRRLAKAMWMGEDFSAALPKVKGRLTGDSISDLNLARETIKETKYVLSGSGLRQEFASIINSINGQECTTAAALCTYLEQLFVDMLHIFFSHLPCAIFKQINDSHVEDYEERVRLMLKFLCQVQSLEGMVQWSFPGGSNITSLVPTQVSSAIYQNNAQSGLDIVSGDPNTTSPSAHDTSLPSRRMPTKVAANWLRFFLPC